MVTWHQLACIAGIILGALALLAGGATYMAGSMSSAPAAGDAAGRQGCTIALVGLAVLAASIAGFWL